MQEDCATACKCSMTSTNGEFTLDEIKMRMKYWLYRGTQIDFESPTGRTEHCDIKPRHVEPLDEDGSAEMPP